MINPFLALLGYDLSDPTEVTHEYFADFATPTKTRQPRKVDYAIAINSNIVILVEAKACTEKPEIHDGQLRGYFNAILTSRVGLSSNGVEYRFFTDLHIPNILDNKPFFVFNILDYSEKDIDNLKLFHRDNFDAASITHHAEGMVYYQNITEIISKLLQSPSDNFVRFLVGEMAVLAPNCKMPGKINGKVIDKFRPIIKKSIQTSLVDLVTRSVSQQMSTIEMPQDTQCDIGMDTDNIEETNLSAIVTTEEELTAFNKIQSIIKAKTNCKHEIQYKDTVSYFGINLGKTTWWFLRLYLSSTKKSFITRLEASAAKLLAPGFTVQEIPSPNGETLSKVLISSVDDFDKLDTLIAKSYETESLKH